MKNILNLNFLLIAILLLLPNLLKAEALECKGDLPPSNTTRFQIDIDLGRPRVKSTIRYFLPDGSTFTQALGINQRKYKSGKVLYIDNFNPSKNLEVQVRDSKLIEATYSNLNADYKMVPLVCELFGEIPAQSPCPKDKNLNLINSVRQSNDLDSVSRALECGANVNFINEQGCTPLMFALDANCGVLNTPIHGSGSGVFSKTKEIIDVLIKGGAYVNVVDKTGESPLIKAVKNNVQNVYDSFIAAEVDMDTKDKLGNTALMYAALGGDPSIVADLLLGNPDRRVKSADGLTAYDLAVQWERERVIDLLKIPDLTIAVVGSADGICSPLSINLKIGQTVELTLKGSARMFRLESKKLSLDLMASPGEVSHQIFLANNKGEYPFTCGFHGGIDPTMGTIHVK